MKFDECKEEVRKSLEGKIDGIFYHVTMQTNSV